MKFFFFRKNLRKPQNIAVSWSLRMKIFMKSLENWPQEAAIF